MPTTIPRYSVVRAVVRMDGRQLEKLFVVLFDDIESGHAVCAKATSNVQFYRNSRDLLAGCVTYPAGSTCFAAETAIQPDNLFLIPHARLDPRRSVVGHLPVDFHEKLVAAIKASVRIPLDRQNGLLRKLGE